jgi:hypothetical protein
MLDTLSVPKARGLLTVQDLIAYPAAEFRYTIAVAAGAILVAGGLLLKNRLPRRVRDLTLALAPPYIFIVGWLLLSYACFALLIPAASFLLDRLPVILGGPGVLLVGLLIAWLSRLISSRHTSVVSASLAAAFVLITGFTIPWRVENQEFLSLRDFAPLLDYLERLPARPADRFYGLINLHLPLVLYTGLPFQSALPVRKSFFDTYPGHIIIVTSAPNWLSVRDPVGVWSLESAARKRGLHLSTEELRSLSLELGTYDARRAIATNVREVVPPVREVPRFAVELLEQQRAIYRRQLQGAIREALSTPTMRGYAFHDDLQVDWSIYFYRFVYPDARRGKNANYASRLKDATATVVAGRWIVYDCPPPHVGQ